jgi:hypothetical protein
MSSEIVVGPVGPVAEAIMQLVLPSGARCIKCFPGTSLVDVQNALVAAGVMATGQQLAICQPGAPVSLTLDVPIASLNRKKLQILANAPASAATDASDPAVATVAATAARPHGKSSPPPNLNPHVGIDAAEYQQRQIQMVADQQKREAETARIIAAAQQQAKDKREEIQMREAKIAADEQKKRAAQAGAAAPRIVIGTATDAVVAKIKIQVKNGAVEVWCHDAEATFATLRFLMESKMFCSKDDLIVHATNL